MTKRMTSTDTSQPKALIYVDGREFMRLWSDNQAENRAMFHETVKRVGGEVAFLVWKPRLQIYLREQLSITASKEA